MKEKVLLRCNDYIYGVQFSLMLPQDKNEFTVINDYMQVLYMQLFALCSAQRPVPSALPQFSLFWKKTRVAAVGLGTGTSAHFVVSLSIACWICLHQI